MNQPDLAGSITVQTVAEFLAAL